MGKTYWITGLSGAGKTTIGKTLYEEIKKATDGLVFLDGDSMRETIARDLGYTDEERLECAYRYGGLCKLLSSQGLIVICCTISMYDEVRTWNRENIENYVEVYVKVTPETLERRDQKKMYSSKEKNLIGFNVSFEEPKAPDIVIENSQNCDLNRAIRKILSLK